jgi:hypothetical protein
MLKFLKEVQIVTGWVIVFLMAISFSAGWFLKGKTKVATISPDKDRGGFIIDQTGFPLSNLVEGTQDQANTMTRGKFQNQLNWMNDHNEMNVTLVPVFYFNPVDLTQTNTFFKLEASRWLGDNPGSLEDEKVITHSFSVVGDDIPMMMKTLGNQMGSLVKNGCLGKYNHIKNFEEREPPGSK